MASAGLLDCSMWETEALITTQRSAIAFLNQSLRLDRAFPFSQPDLQSRASFRGRGSRWSSSRPPLDSGAKVQVESCPVLSSKGDWLPCALAAWGTVR